MPPVLSVVFSFPYGCILALPEKDHNKQKKPFDKSFIKWP